MEERKGDKNGECTVVEHVVVASVHRRLIEMMVVQTFLQSKRAESLPCLCHVVVF